MSVKDDVRTYDGTVVQRVVIDAPLYPPHAPEDDETRPIPDSILHEWAFGRGYIQMADAHAIARELHDARAKLAEWQQWANLLPS